MKGKAQLDSSQIIEHLTNGRGLPVYVQKYFELLQENTIEFIILLATSFF